MKNIVIVRKAALSFFILFSFLLSALNVAAQAIPEMVFQNPVLESGNAGQDGTKYRFSNVVPGLDAVIEIVSRSSASVELSSIDTTGPGLGYVKAFQPVIGIPGNAPSNTTWSMYFHLTFYKTATTTLKTISQFYVTGLDIDGDGGSLSEWATMEKIDAIDTAIVNSLTFNKLNSSGQGDDYKIDGITANSPGIDTTATNVMATYRYSSKSDIYFTIGARTYGSGTSAGMRLNSLWFKEFFNPALPVKLMSFTATLNGSKADLKWITATEIMSSHFVVEKSTDGINYHDAGIVFAAGNSNKQIDYAFSDNLNADKVTVLYYRLRSVDMDGKSEYSDVRVIRNNKTTGNNIITILTYPNPVSNELRITIPANWQNKKVTYELINVNGQTSRRSEASSASQTENMNVSNLSTGFYVVRVSCEGTTVQQKIVKN